MRRVPVVPTLIVLLAVGAMIALGLWQLLDRRPQKLALLAQIEANPGRPPIAFPGSEDDRLLFRRAYGDCRPPVAIALAGAGAAGFRAIARCAHDPARGHGLVVQLGTTRDPMAKVAWRGGPVAGYLTHTPGGQSMIGRLIRPEPQRMMLVLDRPVGGLAVNEPPSVAAVPNNHLAYAVQWFIFAAIALIVYALAMRRRVWTQAPGRAVA